MVADTSSRSALLCAHVFEKYVGFVEEANLFDHLVPPGGPHFAHVFEKGAKFAAEEEAARKVAQMKPAVPKNTQRFFTTLSCFRANEGYIGTRLGRRLLNPPEA